MKMTWAELEQGLMSDDPAGYIEGLRESGALKDVLPEVDALFGVPQPEQHHPEIDSGIHTLMVVKRAAALSDDVAVRYAALVHDLGKGLTPEAEWPKHIGHEETGVEPVKEMSQRLGVPEEIAELAEKVTRHHLRAHRSLEMKPGKIVSLLENIGAFEKPDMLEQFVTTVQADAQGRLGMEDRPYPQGEYLRSAFRVAKDVDAQGDMLSVRRNEAVAELKRALEL